jgi:hypothetical protein
MSSEESAFGLDSSSKLQKNAMAPHIPENMGLTKYK